MKEYAVSILLESREWQVKSGGAGAVNSWRMETPRALLGALQPSSRLWRNQCGNMEAGPGVFGVYGVV